MDKCETCFYVSFFENKCPVKSIKDVVVVKGIGITECSKHTAERKEVTP